MTDCIFCRIIAGDIPADIVHSDDLVVAFRDINPQAPHHIQIIPRRHIETILDFTDQDTALMAHMILTANTIARELGLDTAGYRLVFNCKSDGGQEVYHIHLHLLGGRQMEWPPG
ncbi:MAG: histidine triad nucleotide-binding protein [Candidatus Electryoneaceae bacterium]|nr:histidine triad nucleotide-binding protein [Candidatus Electryoneaceae bacterium]